MKLSGVDTKLVDRREERRLQIFRHDVVLTRCHAKKRSSDWMIGMVWYHEPSMKSMYVVEKMEIL